MPFNTAGTYTPASGATSAAPGQIIASATWNAIFTDIAAALTLLGQTNLAMPSVKTTAGPFTLSTETYIALNKAAPSATTINLPAIAGRNGQSVRIVDWAGNAGDINIVPNGAETIEGLPNWIVASSGGAGFGGSITLFPIVALSGWAVLL